MSKNGSKGRFIAYVCVVILIAALFTAINLQPAQAGYTRWVEYGGNPVIGPPATARAYYPCVLYDSAQFSSGGTPHGASYYYKMWFRGNSTGQFERVAYSNDGTTWSNIQDVSGIETEGYHAKVVYDAGGFGDGSYYYKIWYWDPALIYTISAMHTAESADGVIWEHDQLLTQDTTWPLVTGVGTDWNYGTYGPIQVFYNPAAGNTDPAHPFDYTYAMYYDAATGANEVTALAYSTDGIGWTRYHEAPFANAPVVDHGTTGDWDSGYASQGTVIKESAGIWHYWYSGGQTQLWDGIGYASSTDGINWTKGAGNPLLSKDDGVTWRASRTYTPSVCYSPTRFDGNGPDAVFKMWYSGVSSGGTYAVGYAERSSIITVGPGKDFATIQAAINGAYDGDTIRVDAGTYGESLIINKQLTVESVSGAASTVINYGDPYVVQILSSNVIFDGFTVTNPLYTGGSDASGIVVTDSPSITGVHITNCIVHDIGTMDRSPVTYGTVGINIGQVRNVEVDHCEIYNIGNDNVGDTWAQGISIWGNDASSAATNINIHDCDIHDVASPNAKDSGIGIQGNVSGITVQNCSITNTGEYGVDTWDIWGGEYGPTTITGNFISGATIAGVKMLYPGDNPITGNTLDQCATGILITSSGDASSLRFNTFTNNTGDAVANQSANLIDASWCYWDDPHGPSYSGITYGETFSGSLTWRPYLTVPFGGTPPATPIQVTTASPLPDGDVGSTYAIGFAASGGTQPYGWFTYNGTLPPGLSLSAGGILSGTPTAAGDYTFDIEAADGTQADFAVFTLHVTGAAGIALDKTSSPSGDVVRGQVVTYTLRARNTGSVAATGCSLADAVPAYTDYVSHSTTLNGTLIPDTGGTTPLAAGLQVNSPGSPAGTVAAGSEAVVTLRVQVGADLPLGASIRNVGTFSASGLQPVQGSVINNSSTSLPSTWYFAEGSTQDGFDEYILLSNMGATPMTVTITYLTEGGIERSFPHEVPAHSRRTVLVDAEMPGEAGVAAIVRGEAGLICERSLYFNHNGIDGGHQAIGINAPSTDLFFAEGFTGIEGSPFDEWILVLNPNTAVADLHVTYMFPGGGTVEKDYQVAGGRRLSINVDADIGEGKEVSAKLTSSQPLVAERAMYFLYQDQWGGGSIGKAATGTRSDWYLAEGFTGTEQSPFDEYLLVSNDNATDTGVQVTFMFPDGTTRDFDFTVAAHGRLTVNADGLIGEGQMVSAHVHAVLPVVVERAMYFDYRLQWQGGHNSLGATAPMSVLNFAEGYTGNPDSRFETWLLIQNTSASARTAAVDFILQSGEVLTYDVSLPPSSRTTIYANQLLDREALEFSIRVRSSDGSACLLAERAMYFDYLGSFGRAIGGDDVAGY